jgi:hypothetical protein
MAQLKYWDAGSAQYVALPGLVTGGSLVSSTILNTPTVASSPYTISHNFGTLNVLVQAWDVVTGDLIITRMHLADANHVQVYFEQNAPNNVNVLVLGNGGSLASAPVVAARMTNTTVAQHLAGGPVSLVYGTVEYDSNAACNAANGTFTVPAGQGGDYLVTGGWATTNLAGGNTLAAEIYKNGVIYADGSQVTFAGSGISVYVSTVVRCNAGDTLQVMAAPGAACDVFIGGNWVYMSVHRIVPNLQAVGAYVPPQVPPPSGFNSFTDPSGEVWISRNGSTWKRARAALHSRVFRNVAWTIGTAAAVVNFDTTVRDDYAIYTSAGVFVAPIAGWYSVFLNIAATYGTPPFWLTGSLYLNGGRVGYPTANGPAGQNWIALVFSESYSLAAGDQLYFTVAGSVASIGGGTGNDLGAMGMSYLGPG